MPISNRPGVLHFASELRGDGGGGAPPGGDGKDGVDGEIGAPGINGSAHTDSLNNGTIVGALTVDGAYVDIEQAGLAGPVVIQDGAGFVSAMVNWTTQFSSAEPSVIDGPSTGMVFWKIVSEPGVGPALSDFTSSVGVGPSAPITSATSGTLNFNTNGDQFENIKLGFTPTSSEPRNETFAIELTAGRPSVCQAAIRVALISLRRCVMSVKTSLAR